MDQEIIMEPMIIVPPDPPDGLNLIPCEEWFSEESPEAIGGFVLVARHPAARAVYRFPVEPLETYYLWFTWIGGTDRIPRARVYVEEDLDYHEYPLILTLRQQHYNGYPSLAHGVPDSTGRRWHCGYSYTVLRSNILRIRVDRPQDLDCLGLLEAPTVQVVNSRLE
jgi:hypothetical protein